MSYWLLGLVEMVSTHSRPKAAASGLNMAGVFCMVSTHSRPKAAAFHFTLQFTTEKFQHTAARRRLRIDKKFTTKEQAFQHTAARRRLPNAIEPNQTTSMFQHTAARRRLPHLPRPIQSVLRFNTQPPEGGCSVEGGFDADKDVSTHSRPKAAAPLT